jgi:hypothetical protein
MQAAKEFREEHVVASTSETKSFHQFFQGHAATYRVRVNSFDSMRLFHC